MYVNHICTLKQPCKTLAQNTIWFDIKVKCCKGNTKALHPSKKVYNLYTNICPFPVRLHVKECV